MMAATGKPPLPSKDNRIPSGFQQITLDVGSGEDSSRNKLDAFSAKAEKAIKKSKQGNRKKTVCQSESKYNIKTLNIDIQEEDSNSQQDIFPSDTINRVNLFDRVPHLPQSKPKRTQSAKAKLISDNYVEKAVVVKSRPVSASTVTGRDQQPLEPHRWQYDCEESPRKASSTGDMTSVGGNKDSVPVPYIYGYKSGQLLSGEKHVAAKDESKELVEENVIARKTTHDHIPNTLKPFMSWKLSNDIPKHWLGVDLSQCIVLCPSLLYQMDDLPTIPPKQPADEELDYINKIIPENPIKTKKYSHPWKRQVVAAHQCTHSGRGRLPDAAQVRIYSMDGRLLHETYRGNRTVGVVLKEIQELEDLMKGIGDHDGCLFVQYQAEINDIQNMLNKMSGRVEEIERREEERRRMAESPDYFEMKSFYKQHDDVMTRIKQQHALCVQELAVLEDDLQLDTPRAHFKTSLKVSNGLIDH